ncbi:efflux RND transporter periplasmic adaptor subunit [Winogradskya consettensis]|nr:HlyD family efflux transporter periplasmic adaptor subunit [Actinoplanes consettensis]
MPAPRLGSLRRPTVAVNAALGLLLAGGAFWAYETLSGPDTGTAAAASTRSVPVQQGTVTASVTADGSLESASSASASFVTGGTVTSISVKVGDKVKKGQVLAKVDPAAANRTLDAANADLDAAQASLARAEDAGSDTSTASNEVTQARLAVDEAEAGVTGTTLKAPMAGTVVAVNGTLGSSSSGTGTSSSSSGSQGGGSQGGGQSSSTTTSSSSTSDSGFIDLADLTKLQVTAAFAEADATKLKEKQTATVTWNALSGTEQSAKVVAVDPQATTSNNVVTYGVTLSLDKVPTGAKPGQTVSVSVTTGSVTDALYVNSAALTSVGNRHTVTVLANGVEETRSVEIGLEGDQATEITSGLTAGEQVVIKTTTTTTSGTGTGGGFGGLTGGGGAPAGGGFQGGGGQGRGTR